MSTATAYVHAKPRNPRHACEIMRHSPPPPARQCILSLLFPSCSVCVSVCPSSHCARTTTRSLTRRRTQRNLLLLARPKLHSSSLFLSTAHVSPHPCFLLSRTRLLFSSCSTSRSDTLVSRAAAAPLAGKTLALHTRRGGGKRAADSAPATPEVPARCTTSPVEKGRASALDKAQR